jgi:hypothetical protein
MEINVGRELAALQRMSLPQLRDRYAEVFGEAALTNNRTWLVRRLAWRLQALAEGDLSERARRRAAELANDADLRLNPPRVAPAASPPERTHTATLESRPDGRLPPPGTIITRPYKGGTVQVQVLPQGFEYQGEVYSSLSAVAKAVTGSHCNGFLFFRLNNHGDDQ